MTITLSEVTTDVQTYGKQEYDRAWLTQQGTVDSLSAAHAKDTQLIQQLNGEIALDEKQIADLQAALGGLTPAKVIALAPFTQQGAYGLYTPSGKLLGTGANRAATTYSIPANTAAKTAPTTAGSTNPYHLMMAGSLSQATASVDTDIGNFTLLATDQGTTPSYYGGMRVGWSKGAKIHDLAVKGIPGYASGPPGETFSLATWHAQDSVFTNVLLDGRNNAGTPVAATLFGGNYHSGLTFNKMIANYSKYGFGAALFQNSGVINFIDCDLRYNRKAVNLEQHLGGSIKFLRTDFRGTTGAGYITQVSTLGATISTQIVYEDCLFDNDQCVVNTYPSLSGNGQKDSDIRRIIAGKDVTADLSKFKITHV